MYDIPEMNDPHIRMHPEGAFYYKSHSYGGKWKKWDGPTPKWAQLRYKRGRYYLYKAHGLWFAWRW